MKKILMLMVMVILLIVLGIIGWMIYARLSASPEDFEPTQREESTSDLLDQGDAAEEPQTPPVQPPPQPSQRQDLDTDGDGLTDAKETEYGTDPRNVDSDEDGLFDNEEIMIYQTDPLKNDTDGDSFKDGEEVTHGYNPNGPGRLFEVPQK